LAPVSPHRESHLPLSNFSGTDGAPEKGAFPYIQSRRAPRSRSRAINNGGKMRKLVLVMTFAALAGCASTQTVLNKPATQVFHSTDSQTKVAFCLANKNNTAALDQEDGSKVVLIKNGYGAVSMAFSVYPDGAGSRIEYRKQFGTIGGIWRQCIGPEAEHAEVTPVGAALGA
jgi:hypothetical protein